MSTLQKTSIDAQQPSYLWNQSTLTVVWGQPKSDFLKELNALPMDDNFENDSSNDSLNQVRNEFNSEEDRRLRKLVAMYGDVNWTRISKVMFKSAK